MNVVFNHQILFCNETISELIEVCYRPKFQHYFNKKDIKNMIELLQNIGEFVTIHTTVNLCRDPKDNIWLSLCKDGQADYLITGDADLLILEIFENTKIITLNQFLNTN